MFLFGNRKGIWGKSTSHLDHFSDISVLRAGSQRQTRSYSMEDAAARLRPIPSCPSGVMTVSESCGHRLQRSRSFGAASAGVLTGARLPGIIVWLTAPPWPLPQDFREPIGA
jgi:hypothetical protein